MQRWTRAKRGAQDPHLSFSFIAFVAGVSNKNVKKS
jgi:hypothetical protein